MCRSRRELSNAYLLAKIGVDTAENEPLEVWGENSIQYSLHSLARSRLRLTALNQPSPAGAALLHGSPGGMRQTLQGSFSAVSTPIFASKYSLESSRRDLHNALLCTALESNPKKRGKPWGEKILVQSRENRPGEAHRQLQLSTQCYPRARSRITAV